MLTVGSPSLKHDRAAVEFNQLPDVQLLPALEVRTHMMHCVMQRASLDKVHRHGRLPALHRYVGSVKHHWTFNAGAEAVDAAKGLCAAVLS